MKNSPLILMYHGIKTDSDSIPKGREIGAELYDVSLEQFKAQMTWLRDNKYHAITIDELDHYSPTKQVILTFDDGEMNNFIHALPVLKQLNFKAYFFIIVERIGKPGYMGWDELRQLKESDMVVGSHSLTHSILTNLTDHQLEEEMYNSLKCLVSHLGEEIDALSIPRGFCNDQVIEVAYEAGYQNVFISKRPEDLQAQCLERVAVKASWNVQRFEKAIKGQKPIFEKVLDRLKETSKKTLKGKSYNRLRSFLISVNQLRR